jgi:protein TonB
MSALQKKCLAASAFAHGMLVVVVFVGSAFILPKAPPESPTLELVSVPDLLVDEEVAGGGNPNASPPPAAPVQPPVATPAPEPQVQPAETVQPAPAPVEAPKTPVREPDPEPEKVELPKPEPKPDPKPVVKPSPEPSERPVEKPRKPKIQVDLDRKVTRTIPADRNRKAAREAKELADARAAANRRAEELRSAIGNIASHASSGTTIDVPGPGGIAYAGYGLYLKDVYEKAWIPPAAAVDDEPVVEVEVVISREGKVLSGKIVKKSGNVSLDNTVQRTLNRVRTVRPLPAGTTDEKRTFRINFNLTTKLHIG